MHHSSPNARAQAMPATSTITKRNLYEFPQRRSVRKSSQTSELAADVHSITFISSPDCSGVEIMMVCLVTSPSSLWLCNRFLVRSNGQIFDSVVSRRGAEAIFKLFAISTWRLMWFSVGNYGLAKMHHSRGMMLSWFCMLLFMRQAFLKLERKSNVSVFWILLCKIVSSLL